MEIIVAAKVLIIADGEGLILRNSDTHPRWPLMGDLPGGTVESDEAIETGLLREVEEESGIKLTHADITQLYAVTHSNDEVNVTYHFFVAHLSQKPAVVLDWEHDQYSWVKLADIRGVESPYQEGIDHALRLNLI